MRPPITVDFSDKLNDEKLIDMCKAGQYTRGTLQIYITSPVTFEKWNALFSALSSNPSTYSLSVYGSQSKQLNDDFFAALAEMFKTNTTIRHLHIKSHNITSEQVEVLSSAISSNTILHSLSLCDFQLHGEKLGLLLTGISANRTLQSLVFNENNITNEAVPSCIKFLESHSNIISFDISNNAIGDEGAKLFADFLKTNTSLLDFNIGKNPLTHIGNEYFCQALKSYKGPIVQFRHHNFTAMTCLSEEEGVALIANNSSLLNCSVLSSAFDTILCARVLSASQAVNKWMEWKKESPQCFYNKFTEDDFKSFFPLANAIKFNLSQGGFSHLVPTFNQDLVLAYTKAAQVAPVMEIYCCTTEIPTEIVELILMAIAHVQSQGQNPQPKQY